MSSTSPRRRCRFRPCIDLRGGRVVQIVGGTLRDEAAAAAAAPSAVTNFEAREPPAAYARRYARDALAGGHVIMLGGGDAQEAAAREALAAFPGGLQVGGGVTAANARALLDAGAAAVIVTSFVFRDGKVDRARLAEIEAAAGRERLVLDLSCRKRRRAGGASAAGGDFEYVVVTDRWQTWTDCVVDAALLADLGAHCAEFLVHGVDVEGLRQGVEDALVELLGAHSPVPVTYAGGVRDMADVERVARLGGGRVDVSVGSALDIFGGTFAYDDLVKWNAAADVVATSAPG